MRFSMPCAAWTELLFTTETYWNVSIYLQTDINRDSTADHACINVLGWFCQFHRCAGSPHGNARPAEQSWNYTRVHTLTIPDPAPQLQNLFDCPSMHFFRSILLLLLPILTMSTEPQSTTVTRIATFRFKPEVTASQKGDRARAFLDLYAQHQDLILGMPKGGKPLDTPLELTGVKRDKEWDMGFRVVFKVGFFLGISLLGFWIEVLNGADLI